ncbi:MAG TPA: sensor histidine kinase [Terriglobales bacterium]|jgi:two-component system sensor histidine kinase UhpB
MTTQTLDLPRHLLRAQEQERKRISRELHDETGQGLMLLRLYLEMLANNSESRESHLKVQEALDLLDRTIGDLRRIIARLSPRILEEMGLLAAIRKEARELCKHTGLRARLELPKPLGDIPHEIEIALYRLVQEALHNIAKHAKATNFLVRVEFDHWGVRLLVEDDGMGFSRASGSRSRSFGIAGMRERIAALGGHVRIRSRKGRGTQLKVLLPVSTGARRKQIEVLFDQTRENAGSSSKVYSRKKSGTRIAGLGILKSDVQHANVH